MFYRIANFRIDLQENYEKNLLFQRPRCCDRRPKRMYVYDQYELKCQWNTDYLKNNDKHNGDEYSK